MTAGPDRPTPTTRTTGAVPRLDVLQVATVLVAVYLLVLGIVAVARAGFFTQGVTSPVVEVGPLQATPVLGLLLILAGLVLLWAASGVEIDDVSIRVISGIVLVLGIVLVIEPGAFEAVLGSERNDGWHHILIGGVLLVLTFLPPIETPPAPRAAPPADDRTRRLDDPPEPRGDDDPTQRIR